MSSRILRKVDATTLKKVANFQPTKEAITSDKRQHVVNALQADIEEAGVKHLVQVMKRDQLAAAVETLDIDHGNNNPNNSMVLSKRLKESMTEQGVKAWLANCENEEVVRQMGKALGIRGFSTVGIRVLRKTIEEELDIIGTQIVFGSLNLQLLRECCVEMNIENASAATSKKPLLQAMTLGVAIPAPQKAKKKGTRKPKFTEIDNAEATYEQLFQHYYLDQLVSWCKENGLKSSGNKKAVINRILAFHAGDKENTMADTTKVNKPKTKKTKAPAKETPAPSRVSSRKKVVEEEDEPMDDANEESSEEQVADEEQEASAESEASDVDMELSNEPEEDSEHPTSLEGLVVALGVRPKTMKKADVPALVERNGGTFHADKKISKSVNVLILSEEHIASGKFDKLKATGTKLVTEEFLKNLQ